jgi:hypothetical protein
MGSMKKRSISSLSAVIAGCSGRVVGFSILKKNNKVRNVRTLAMETEHRPSHKELIKDVWHQKIQSIPVYYSARQQNAVVHYNYTIQCLQDIFCCLWWNRKKFPFRLEDDHWLFIFVQTALHSLCPLQTFNCIGLSYRFKQPPFMFIDHINVH